MTDQPATSKFFTQTYGNSASSTGDFYVVRLYRNGTVEIDYQGFPVEIISVEEVSDRLAPRSLRVTFTYDHRYNDDTTRRYTKIAAIMVGVILIVNSVNDHEQFTKPHLCSSGDAVPNWVVRKAQQKRSLLEKLIDKAVELVLRLPHGRSRRD